MVSLRKIVATIFALALAGPVKAEISSHDFAKCSSMEGELARLDCFDKLAREKNLDGPQTQQSDIENKGSWVVKITNNPVDDSKTVNMILDATSGTSSYGKGVFLVVRCKSNTTELYINWQDYLGSDAYVLTRIGDEEANTKEWSLSTDSKATFHPKGTIRFLMKMMASDKFLAQVTPYNENPVTAIFNTHGMKNAIKPLRETCHWSESHLKKKAKYRADNPQEHLEERLNKYKKEFDRLYNMKVVGASVVQSVEGNSWKPFYRDNGAIESIVRSLKLVEKASEIFPSAHYQITVNGTTHRGRVSSDGGSPFTSKELALLAQAAINEMGWEKGKYTLIAGPEKEPERYGEESEYRILRGKVKSTGEIVAVKVINVEK